MRAVGQYIILKEDPEEIKKTAGGLELNEKTREDIRYRTGRCISVGEAANLVSQGERILFDKAAGHLTDVEGSQHRIITIRDVVAVL